ncbi:MAG: putative glycoside hydrolase [Patescibacteria group bacterium]
MKRACLAVFLLISLSGMFVIGAPATSAAYGTQDAPKLINLWFDWQITDSDVQALSKWDVIVLDMDQQMRFPDKMRAIKRLNSNIKLLAYIDSSDIAAAKFVEESNFPGYALAHRIPEQWYLHRGTARVGFWPGAWMLNMTDACPTDGGLRWNQYLPQFIQQNVWSTGLWDGIFLDNALAGPTWFVGNGLDMNGDTKAEPDASVNAAWNRGWKAMANDLRARLGSKAILMGNGDAGYASNVNGILFEDFPTYGFASGLSQYRTAVKQNTKPSYSAINSNANNVQNPQDYRDMRLGLGSAMLSDGYYSFDFGNKDHGQTWWYDEYDAKLGNPTSDAQMMTSNTSEKTDAVWWRDFTNGSVLVNGTKNSQTISLPGVFERLRGTQDTAMNSGRLETSIALAPRDAILLYRRSKAVSIPMSTSYVNGSFVRVYAPDGSQVRAGFFIQRSDAAGGANVLTADVDRDGKADMISANKGAIKISYGSGGSKTIRPFGNSFTGSISIAAGNADRDASYEIVAGRDGSDEVKILELNGTVRANWHAYVPAFKGGVNVAIGDVNGDGMRDVVTGAGPTGGPQIRLFKTDGSLFSNGFFAFDKNERGGVSVAVGDIDGDGKDEIIAGSGRGTIPRVRIFSANGTLIREFALGKSPFGSGVAVSLTDLNSDGRLEILTTSPVSP